MERDLRTIRARWRAAKALATWREQAPSSRECLLDELEEMQREASSTDRGGEASVLAVAIALLEGVSRDGALSTWDEATADVEWLLDEVESLRRRLHLPK